MRTLCRLALLALAVAAIAAAAATPASAQPKPLPALTPAPRDALTRALQAGRLSEAEYALERAQSIFQLWSVRAEFGDVKRAGPRDATLLLRDLALRLRLLSGKERDAAERILARPTDGAADPQEHGYAVAEAPPICGADMCFHWVESTRDAPPGADNDPATIPQQVTDTQEIFEEVWAAEVGLGYRAPLSDVNDTNNGGDGRLDIYLADLGSSGIFGYCAVDQFDSAEFAVPVYCVVDDDFDPFQFQSSRTAEQLLQVTAAHEFFHAVQAAYDFFEDFWLMEGTAANMEETVYASVNDNISFLRASQLRHPSGPLDRSGFGDTEYGAWIWWRYLEEKAYDGDPGIIRRIWRRADASALAAYGDEYSLQATRRALAWDDKPLPDEYARFAVANRRRDYLDGRRYPRPQAAQSFWLGRRRLSTGLRTGRLNHLATRFIAFRPGKHAPRSAKLRIRAELNRHAARATLIIAFRNGRVWVRKIGLGPSFSGARTVPFGRRTVKRIDLVLTNGSSRTRNCFSDVNPPFYSCFGIPRDDRQRYRYRASIRS